jgi:hypothetical protein
MRESPHFQANTRQTLGTHRAFIRPSGGLSTLLCKLRQLSVLLCVILVPIRRKYPETA